MADQNTAAAAGAAGSAAATAVGVDPSIGQAGGSAAGSGLCDCCCKSGSSAAAQKAAITAANPPNTGDPAADAAITAANNAAFQKWQAADDIKQFDTLPASTQAQLPAVVAFANAFMSKIPVADQGMTLADAAAKYPDLASQAYAQIQQTFPALKNVPLATAMALAQASGVATMKISDLKARLDNIVQNDPTAKAIMANATGASATGGSSLGTIALLAGSIAAVVFIGKKVIGK